MDQNLQLSYWRWLSTMAATKHLWQCFCSFTILQGGPKSENTSIIVNLTIWDFTYLRCWRSLASSSGSSSWRTHWTSWLKLLTTFQRFCGAEYMVYNKQNSVFSLFGPPCSYSGNRSWILLWVLRVSGETMKLVIDANFHWHLFGRKWTV